MKGFIFDRKTTERLAFQSIFIVCTVALCTTYYINSASLQSACDIAGMLFSFYKA